MKKHFSSEAVKAGLQEPYRPVEEMTEEELKEFRTAFDPDMMGFDGAEGVDAEEGAKEEEESDNDREGEA